MFPVTITLHDAAQLNAVMAALQATTAAAKVEAPKPQASKTTAATTALKTSAAPTPTATTSETESPKPATPAAAPASTPAPAASTASPAASSGMTAEELTKVIVAAVARTSKEAVLGVLKGEFGVSAGKEITDPAIRAKAAAVIGGLA